MARKPLPEKELRNILANQTTNAMRRNARFIATKVQIIRREGEPNWDANLGIGPPPLLKAFAFALSETQRFYDLE
jgi:hypothetical protein